MPKSKPHQSAIALSDGRISENRHAQAEDRRLGIIDLARQQHQQEGLVEIDNNPQLSDGISNGCYVQAWVWVDFTGTPFDKEQQS